MAVADAYIGHLSVVEYHPAKTVAFPSIPTDTAFTGTPGTDSIVISQARSFGGPELSAPTVDVTNFGSPGGTRETIAGLLEGGEASMEVIYTHALALDLWDATDPLLRLKRWWRITLPDGDTPGTGGLAGGSTMMFPGTITGASFAIEVDDAIVMELTLSVDGAVTFTEHT